VVIMPLPWHATARAPSGRRINAGTIKAGIWAC
jgi:hypothetical protein